MNTLQLLRAARRVSSALALAIILALAGLPLGAAAPDRLYDGFRSPPPEARPDVYWWWNGNAVTEEEIHRELGVLRSAGIGGVLIFPMAMTMGATPTGAESLDWLAPEWVRMVEVAVDGARQRGMGADLLVGTGWPFGGPFLRPGEQLQRVKVVRKELTGPATFVSNITELMSPPGGAYGETTNGLPPRLLFLRLVPADTSRVEPGTDLLACVADDGSVGFDVPPGRHVLYTGTLREGFMVVNIAAPGGEGPVLDHFSEPATASYLSRFADAFGPAPRRILAKLRSLHCDSFEFTGANWTTDLPVEFGRRRGYGLDPYLPVAVDDAPPQGDPAYVDTVWRVRDDFWKTLSELFSERFLVPFDRWCHAQGTESRIEAYGCPATDHLDPKLIADRPMCETWISVERNIPKDETLIPVEGPRGPERLALWSTMSNKYTSSAAHLRGRKEVSCETMTNDLSAFRTTLEQIKMACDLNFVTGVNHPVFHGYNYNPPEAGFPGWFYCGEYFDERNTWWPHFRRLTDYVARLSWVLQESTSVAEVALMDPTHRLWELLHQNGYSADYVSGALLRTGRVRDGKLCLGRQRYDVLLLNSVRALEQEDARAIRRLVGAGARVLFLGQVPSRSPGLAGAPESDRAVQAAMSDVLEADPTRVLFAAAPADGAHLSWVRRALEKFGVRPGVSLVRPDPLLYQIHQRFGDRDIFFFANLSCDRSIATWARFAVGDAMPWRWDPETGRRWPMPYDPGLGQMDLSLRPMESLLLVFEPGSSRADIAVTTATAVPVAEYVGPWHVEFSPVAGAQFSRALPRLLDFAYDEHLSSFAGVATYHAEVELRGSLPTELSLGAVHDISEATLNGVPLGCRWWGDHRYDVSRAVRTGENTLVIRVTTSLSNYVRSLQHNPVARIWTSEKSRPVLSSGLLGPVQWRSTRPWTAQRPFAACNN